MSNAINIIGIAFSSLFIRLRREPITGPPDYDNPTDALSGKISPETKE